MVKRMRIPAYLALLLWCGNSIAASFTAAVDRKDLYVNEHVVLTLELQDSDTRLRAEGVAPNVDLTVLSAQFDLGIPRADFRFNINRNRGRSSSTVVVELFPRRSGRLRIPSFTVEGLSTAPIDLRVANLPADAAPEVFSRSGLAKRNLLIREQTLLYLDLYHRVALKSARLGGPLDTQPRQVEVHALPAVTRTERMGGFDYEITRTAWAISPLVSEAVTFYLPDIWIETQQGRQWHLPVREERIEVRALPPDTPLQTLIGQPQLQQTPVADGAVGRLLPWRLTLRSATALNALPATPLVDLETPGLKIYMDPAERRVEMLPDGSGVESVAIYQAWLMPLAGGEVTLPTVSLPYYDPDRETLAASTLPAQTLHATPAPAMTETPSPEPDKRVITRTDSRELAWPLATLVLALLWLATLWLWWRGSGSRRAARMQVRASSSAGAHGHKDRLLTALGSQTLEQGLRTWESRHGIDAGLRDAVRLVQRLCYRPDGGIDDKVLGEAVDSAITHLRGRYPPGEPPQQDPWSPRAFRSSRTFARPID